MACNDCNWLRKRAVFLLLPCSAFVPNNHQFGPIQRRHKFWWKFCSSFERTMKWKSSKWNIIIHHRSRSVAEGVLHNFLLSSASGGCESEAHTPNDIMDALKFHVARNIWFLFHRQSSLRRLNFSFIFTNNPKQQTWLRNFIRVVTGVRQARRKGLRGKRWKFIKF